MYEISFNIYDPGDFSSWKSMIFYWELWKDQIEGTGYDFLVKASKCIFEYTYVGTLHIVYAACGCICGSIYVIKT
jgi:hypothetical protein